ncbi:uncharacterized protein A4U43_C02F5940 [Asparagus officinalis]|uniref:RRM domain-containing protein n=1 Tax=Asparagus officinalis TaxID=4686 RepID=A0A5P1FL31_ASPOF|nr:RNA-binding protein 24-A-like [Asparagus officinalis]ONK77381.1 uncharacterized protein A4U43_C02F5940 [Asparagus officinalis]
MGGAQFGDTTYTKVFVGGLAWETKKETMKKYFEQFGEILEAVVISDKITGRSKGYGFVTFREAEAATKACVDPSPVIDGRRANCNLASLGVQRSRPASPQYGGGRGFRAMKSYGPAGLQGGMGTAFASAATFPAHYALQQGFPYGVYGYSPFAPDYTYPQSYYNVYGGASAAQFPVYGGVYPYIGQFGQGGGAGQYTSGQSYGVQYPQMYQYSAMASAAGVTTGFAAQHYAGHVNPQAQLAAGMTMPFPAPSLPTPTPHHYRLIPPPFAAPGPPEQPLA